MKKKNIVLCSMMILSVSLCGCQGIKPSLPKGGLFSLFEKKPKTVEDLLERSAEAQKDLESCHIDGKMNMDINLNSPNGVSMSMPYGIEISMDTGKKSAHAVSNVKGTVLGVSQTNKVETYYDIENGKAYSKQDGSTAWIESNEKIPIDSLIDTGDVGKSFPEGAELKAEDDKYVIKVDAKDLKEFDSYIGMDDSVGSLGEIKVEGGDVEYEFDASTYYLIKVTIDDLKMSGNNSDVNYDATVNYDIDISEHNEVSEDKYTIPKDVTENTTKESGQSSLFPGTNAETPTTEAPIEETPTTEAPATEAPSTSQGETGIAVDDKYGAINGIPLTTGPNVFSKTFATDGFEIDESSDNQYSFSVCKNPKYENLNLYVFQKDSLSDNCNKAEIEKNGFYGYEIDASGISDMGSRPNMSWNGVTWGDSYEKIEQQYGKPSDTYDSDMYTKYTYLLSNQIQMCFYVYKAGQTSTGLQHVTLYVFD